MSRRQPPRAANPANSRPIPQSSDHFRQVTDPATGMARSGYFANTAADFDGSVTDELVRTVGLLLANSASDVPLRVLARELATNVERRDAQNVIAQLRWRLDELGRLHKLALEPGARRGL